MKKIFFSFMTIALVFSFVSTSFSTGTANMYSPSALKAAYEKDSTTLDGKEVTVEGQVNSVQLSKTNYYISLRDAGKSGYDIYCAINLVTGEKEPTAEVNSNVKVTGTVGGKFFKSIKLNKCKLVQ